MFLDENRSSPLYFITGSDSTMSFGWIGKSLKAGPDSSYVYLGISPGDQAVPGGYARYLIPAR